jgi:hypothetical protein
MTLPTPTTAKEEAEPKRVMQTELGPRGNCQSACLAMLLGLELSEVPNFAVSDETWEQQASWLLARGLWRLTVVPWQGLPWPPAHGFYIAGGVSPRGHRHSVIYRAGELWHDPHPEGGGIQEVQEVDLLLPAAFAPLADSQALLRAEAKGEAKGLRRAVEVSVGIWGEQARRSSQNHAILTLAAEIEKQADG